MSEQNTAGLKGLIVPVLTPMQASGEIDREAFIRHLTYLQDRGVKRIMINGTTGEFHSLLPGERRRQLQLARAHFDGFIVLHVGGCSLLRNRSEIRRACRLGADAVAALPPVYPAGLPAQGIIDYLRALSAESQIPFVLYNFPRHTGNALTPEILQAVPHAALKDSGREPALMAHTPAYFIGSSTQITEAVRLGAAGFVSASANVRPELYTALETMLASARTEEAALLQQEVLAYSAPFSRGGVPMLKQALSRILPGYPVHVRLPLCCAD